MSYSDVQRYLGPALSRLGFTLDAVDADVTYGERSAWAVYYRASDCRLQVCWSECEGGIDFMLAPLDVPNEFGLAGTANGWNFLLMLSKSVDDLPTPALDAGDEVLWQWHKALLETHIDEARPVLASKLRADLDRKSQP